MTVLQLTDLDCDPLHQDPANIVGGVAARHMDPVLGIDIHIKTIQKPR